MKEYWFLDGSSISVDDDTCRGCHLESANGLPKELFPVWENESFVIRQDAECPVPGFYILSTKKHIMTIGDLSPREAAQIGIISNRLRVNMLNALGIQRIHMILEERMINPHLHIWFLPLWQDVMTKYNIDPKVWNSNILQYLQLFKYEENCQQILTFNRILKYALMADDVLLHLGVNI